MIPLKNPKSVSTEWPVESLHQAVKAQLATNFADALTELFANELLKIQNTINPPFTPTTKPRHWFEIGEWETLDEKP